MATDQHKLLTSTANLDHNVKIKQVTGYQSVQIIKEQNDIKNTCTKHHSDPA